MKLLFGQNISYCRKKKLVREFPDSVHFSNVGILNSADFETWEHAKVNEYTIVTFDADFYELNLIQGGLLKIIWLKDRNLKTDSLAQKLINHKTVTSENSLITQSHITKLV